MNDSKLTPPSPAFALLAKDHTGMRVDYRGLFMQCRAALSQEEPAHAEMLRQFENHMTELGKRWYAGDTSVVDEFLQLYCVEHDARSLLAYQMGALEHLNNVLEKRA